MTVSPSARKSQRLGAPAALLLLCLGLFSCGKESQITSPSKKGALHWQSFPVPLKVEESILDGGEQEEDLMSAISFWELKAGKRLFQLGPWSTGRAPYRGSPADPEDLVDNTLIFLSPWPFESTVAGKTMVLFDGSLIQKAVVYLNKETPLCYRLCENTNGQTSRRKLIAHELGHFLGFDHVQDPDNVMYPEIRPGGALDNLKVDEPLLRKLTAKR